jgi:hypothetical protein
MNGKPRSDAELLAALDESLASDVLDPEYPIEWVDEDLRAMGVDPEEVAKRGVQFVKRLLSEREQKANS